MIKCQICNTEFENVIGWKHLKKHNITTAEYKLKYGEVASAEYKAERSAKCSGKNNPMYGKRWEWSDAQKANIKGRAAHNTDTPMSDKQKEKLRLKAIDRNQQWISSGQHPTKGKTYDEIHGQAKANDIKQQLRNANLNKTRDPDSITKGIGTKRNNGYLTSGMKGKTHSDETKKRISESSTNRASERRATAIQSKIHVLDSIGYKLLAIADSILTLECDNGHVFNRTAQVLTPSKFKETLCPVCHPPNRNWVSTAENEIANYVSSFDSNILRGVRSVISGELDIYLPDVGMAIEYNGLYWHNDTFKTKNYHLTKTQECERKGIKLIHIFEDEWINNRSIVESRLSGMLNQNRSIFARKCHIKEISSNHANEFLNANHIQGGGRANIHVGLFSESTLVAVMTFLHGDISKKVVGWELNRFCSLQFINVVGGASRLFKYFVNAYSPDHITTFADRRWSNTIGHTLYDVLGFEKESISPPNYWYVMPNQIKRHHRFGLRKPNGSSMTEREIRDQQGWSRIWDCGSLKYVWQN